MEDARKIARVALENKSIACAKFLPVQSAYRWKGRIVEEDEVMVFFQTSKNHVPKLIEWIKENHTYEVPEITEIEMKRGNEEFFKWISEVTE
jgi:periplasmic divalent cation tolerance protein